MATLSAAALARAAGPLGENGDPITTSDYAVDLFIGSVIAGNRVTGLGGAYVAIAEDVDGNLQNPAAPAMRPFYSVDRVDYWLGLGLTFPASYSSSDFFNSGSLTNLERARESVFVTPALNVQWGTLGLGFTAEVQEYDFPAARTEAAAELFSMSLVTLHYQVADAYWDGQWVVGAGIRQLVLDVSVGPESGGTSTSLFETSAVGIEVGTVWRPNGQPFRLGLAFRDEIETRAQYSKRLLPNDVGDVVIDAADGPLYLPERATLPWDLNVGAALQLGSRPFNAKWRPPEELAERSFLQTRLARLDREQQAELGLRSAASEAEREQLRSQLDRDREQDDEFLAQEAEAAKRRLLDEYARMDRFYVLLSGALQVTGAARGAVGVESLLGQRVNRSGERLVLAPHFGAESEVWSNVLELRAGTYLQPARFRTADARWHATLGANLRLFRWSIFGLWPDDFVWSIGGNVDAARRYLTWGFALTGWYPRGSAD